MLEKDPAPDYQNTKIHVSGKIIWISEDRKCFSIAGFGFIHANQPLGPEVKKFDLRMSYLKLWTKETSPGAKIRRFYEVEFENYAQSGK